MEHQEQAGPRPTNADGRARPVKLPDQIARVLRAQIATGFLVAGARLPTERELCQIFGASRSAVREAVSKLKYDGLLQTRQGSGTYVAQDGLGFSFRIEPGVLDDHRELGQIFELRMTFEAAAAALAARRRTQEQLAKIRQALDQMDLALRRGEDAVQPDTMFHLAIGEATGNAYFKAFMEFLEARLRRSIEASRAELERDRRRAREVHAEHVAIYEAIEAGDPERARAAALLHLDHAAEELGILPFEARGHPHRAGA